MKYLAIATLFACTDSAFAQANASDPQGSTGMNTTYGPTGLINIPSAFTIRDKEARVGGTWGEDLNSPSVNFGIANSFEIGGAYIIRRDASNKPIASAKVTFTPGNFKRLTFGVGIIDAVDAIDQTIYVVGSFDLTPPTVHSQDGAKAVAFRGHVGAGSGLFRDSIFGGGELTFDNRFTIVAEHDGVNVNGALRFKADNDMQLQVGFKDKAFFVGMSSPIRF